MDCFFKLDTSNWSKIRQMVVLRTKKATAQNQTQDTMEIMDNFDRSSFVPRGEEREYRAHLVCFRKRNFKKSFQL